jgi:ankyrin repeat protein
MKISNVKCDAFQVGVFPEEPPHKKARIGTSLVLKTILQDIFSSIELENLDFDSDQYSKNIQELIEIALLYGLDNPERGFLPALLEDLLNSPFDINQPLTFADQNFALGDFSSQLEIHYSSYKKMHAEFHQYMGKIGIKNAKDREKYNPSFLHFVCMKGDLELLNLLAYHPKVDFDVKLLGKFSIFYIVCYTGSSNFFQSLLNSRRIDLKKAQQEGQQIFYNACSNNQADLVKRLLKLTWIDFNQGDAYGNTPLHMACFKGHLEVVEILLDSNEVQHNKGNRQQIQPIHHAFISQDIEIIKMMLKSSKVDKRDLDKIFDESWHISKFFFIQEDISIIQVLVDQLSLTSVALSPLLSNVPHFSLLFLYMKYGSLKSLEIVLGLLFCKFSFLFEYDTDYNRLDLACKSFLSDKIAEEKRFLEAPDAWDTDIEERQKMITLLEQCQIDLYGTAKRFAFKYGFLEEKAAEWLASMVLYEDEYIRLKENKYFDGEEAFLRRFLDISRRLPLEMKGIISNNAAHLRNRFILKKDLDPAIKRLLNKI